MVAQIIVIIRSISYVSEYIAEEDVGEEEEDEEARGLLPKPKERKLIFIVSRRIREEVGTLSRPFHRHLLLLLLPRFFLCVFGRQRRWWWNARRIKIIILRLYLGTGVVVA